MKIQDQLIMAKIESLNNKMSAWFIDHCNVNGIDLVKWHRWQLHLMWEQRNINRILTGYFSKRGKRK